MGLYKELDYFSCPFLHLLPHRFLRCREKMQAVRKVWVHQGFLQQQNSPFCQAFNALPYDARYFFWPFGCHCLLSQQKGLSNGCQTFSALGGLFLSWASRKPFPNNLSILCKSPLKFSCLHFQFTLHVPCFFGLSCLPHHSLLHFLIESCGEKEGELKQFSVCVRCFT